ncbi:hypothetical protein EON65_56620 [archaeon]|nr:MAG: hypothetical protein EON65_56620 [archaeon]
MNELIYDSYGLLQDVMRALRDNANLIPLHVRTEIARRFVEALRDDPEGLSVAAIPTLLPHDIYRQRASMRPSKTASPAPPLSMTGNVIAQ